MRSVLALLGLAAACSKDSGSLFGWTVDELEVEVDSLKKRADSSDAEIVALKATVASLQQRIAGVEGDLTCSAGTTLDTCKCSAGFVSLPWVQNGNCVDESEYVCQQEKKNYNEWRLPRTADGKAVTEPSHYNVKLHLPGLYEEDKIDGAFHFSGESEVIFKANDDICFFSMHLDYKPKVTRVIVTVGGVDVPVTYNLNPDYYYLTIYADHKIVSGSEVKAMVHYENEVPTGTKGLYLSHYTNPDGVKRYLLTTQFESTGARMAFPCFDEPDLKAIFNFEISYRYSEYTAIFNMDPIGPPNQVGDRYTVKYQPTMKISTYILAMLISDFNTDSSGVSADGVKVRILGRKEWENETNWALEETLSVVDGLSEKFGYKYCNAFPEPSGPNGNCKSDQVSVPQFGAGAMENWGLITYREYYMHIDQARDPFRRKYYSTSIIGHELIHQWFGNLVTCPWWDEIYINEAFGSIGGYLGLIYSKSHAKINYQWEDEYLIDEGYSGMYTDGTIFSRPMVNNVNNGELKVETPQELSNQFDRIAYPKSGSVMMMIRAVLGDELWTMGLQNYLQFMKFDVSTGDNLLTFWDGVLTPSVKENRLGNMTASEAFEPFFKQMGLPALKINEFHDELGNLKIAVSSSRYLNTKHNKLHPQSSFKYVWNVPVVLRENGVDTFNWIKAGETNQVYEFNISESTVVDPESNIWMRINFNQQYLDRVTNLVDKLQARSISKMIRDHMTFLTEETRDEYDVDLEKVLSLFSLIDPTETVAEKKIRWGQWSELSQTMNHKVWNVFTTYLANSQDGSIEADIYSTFTDHLRVLTNFWKADGLYPDVEINDPAEDKWYGDWSRLNQFLIPLARRFDSAAFAVDAIEYIKPVVDGVDFMELSPDSRADSFYAAVQAGDVQTTDFALNKINTAVDDGMSIDNIRLCRSIDSASSVSVGLYTGDCRENIYFIALSFSKSIHVIEQIASRLPKDLVGYFYINVASRDDMSIAVTQHVQAKSALEIENNWVSGQFTSFVETSCNYFSSPEHREILREWSNKAWNDEFRSSLSASLTICENAMTANEELMDLHYSSFTNFYCKMDSLSCGEDTIGSPSSFNSWYLPRNEMGESHYKPTQYYVDLSIRNLTEGAQEDGDFYYDGTSQVDLTSSVALDEIHIHVDREEFMKITGYVVRANGKVVPVRKTVHNSNRFLFSFYLDATIPADTQISLIMNYVVKLTTATEGLYLGHYEDEATKETLYLLSTQFESTHARECFPCFDEPSLKAQYKFTIEFDKGVRQDYTAIYNMDIENEIDLGNNRQKNVYYNSMPMATYLNAILVSPFNTESKGVSEGINAGVRILGRPEWKDDTIYALNEAMSIVSNFSTYFDWDYCHAFKKKTNNNAIGELVCKTDQTGIPQFRSGAMENWGLITYREYYLHYNSQRDTNLVRRTVTRIVGHELIHQWFGNLITCKWWDEIYINEAWGSIGGYLGLQQAESMNNVEYEWEDEYLTTQGYSGFTYDGRNTSRPMVNNANNGLLKVETPNEISRQFDSIAYNKAGSVMMMIREVIGEDLWQAGLRKYLKDNQYTSPTWREQLQAWDDVVPDFKTNEAYGANDTSKPANLTEAFKPYFLQMGYPLLEISKYSLSVGQYTIKHSRFMSNNGELSQPESDYGYEWNVPIIFTDKLDKRSIKWIKTSCEGADTIIALAEDAVIDPNAKTWLRIKFSDDIISDYASNNRVKKRQAAKTVQDVYQMAISPRYKATVSYADAMKATKLLANFPAEKQNWIVYREMTDFNTFASRLVAATMDSAADTGEAEFAEAFRSYMFGLVNNNAVHDSNNYQTTPDRCYPDEDGVGLPRDESKARMAPYVTQTQLYYASTDQSFFEQAKRLSDKLVDGSLPFLEQSADTRPDTFIGAVIKEEADLAQSDPINAAKTPVINHFLNKLKLNNTDFKCSSTQLSYPLYSTKENLNCELHRYWNALLSIRTQEGYYKLYNKLPVKLQPVYTVEAAANKYLFRFIVNSFATSKEPIDVKNYLQTPRRLNSLVSNSCSYMTLQSDLNLQMAWKDELLDWTDESNVNIRETRDNCVSNILARSANFKNDYASVRNWLCADLNAAQPGSCDWSSDTIVFA